MNQSPSLFDSISAHSNCTCSFCWLIWEMIEAETINSNEWYLFSLHLKSDHGWVEDEVTD